VERGGGDGMHGEGAEWRIHGEGLDVDERCGEEKWCRSKLGGGGMKTIFSRSKKDDCEPKGSPTSEAIMNINSNFKGRIFDFQGGRVKTRSDTGQKERR